MVTLGILAAEMLGGYDCLCYIITCVFVQMLRNDVVVGMARGTSTET